MNLFKAHIIRKRQPGRPAYVSSAPDSKLVSRRVLSAMMFQNLLPMPGMFFRELIKLDLALFLLLGILLL